MPPTPKRRHPRKLASPRTNVMRARLLFALTSISPRLIAVALLSALITGCLDEGYQREAEPGPVQIFSWWTSPSEAAALAALIRVHTAKYPNVKVLNAAESLADKARYRLVDRMSSGLPPDTFQANIGEDLMRWVLFNGVDDEQSKVESLNGLAERNDWDTQFPDVVLDALSFEKTMYGVPVNIHRINSMFYNKKILEELDLSPPEDLDQLHVLLDQLVEAGYRYPLSIGSNADWTLSLLAMENLFPAVVGPDFYEEYWNGKHRAEHPKMVETLRELLKLWPYFNPDANDLDWTEGVDKLLAEDAPKDQQAVLTVMGDWAKGHLIASGYKPGEDFVQIPFPGSQGTFVFTADSFPLPKGAPHRADAINLLETFGSRRGQLAFNALKGSIPARQDIDPEELGPLAQDTWKDFHEDRVVRALSGILDDAFATALSQAVKDTLTDNDPDPVLFALRNNYGN